MATGKSPGFWKSLEIEEYIYLGGYKGNHSNSYVPGHSVSAMCTGLHVCWNAGISGSVSALMRLEACTRDSWSFAWCFGCLLQLDCVSFSLALCFSLALYASAWLCMLQLGSVCFSLVLCASAWLCCFISVLDVVLSGTL